MQTNIFLGLDVIPFSSKKHGLKYLTYTQVICVFTIRSYMYNVVLKVFSKFVTMSIDARYKWGMPLLDLSMHKSSSYI